MTTTTNNNNTNTSNNTDSFIRPSLTNLGTSVASTIDAGVENRGGVFKQTYVLARNSLVIILSLFGFITTLITIINELFGRTAFGKAVENDVTVLTSASAKTISTLSIAGGEDLRSVYNKSKSLLE